MRTDSMVEQDAACQLCRTCDPAPLVCQAPVRYAINKHVPLQAKAQQEASTSDKAPLKGAAQSTDEAAKQRPAKSTAFAFYAAAVLLLLMAAGLLTWLMAGTFAFCLKCWLCASKEAPMCCKLSGCKHAG